VPSVSACQCKHVNLWQGCQGQNANFKASQAIVQATFAPCLQVNSEIPSVQDQMDEAGEWCSKGGVGNALIQHSTIAKIDHKHASCVDTRFAGHSKVASPGTRAFHLSTLHNADMAML
jgi:hypothetical protein